MDNPLASPITLLALVFGLVEFCKKLDLQGKALTVVSLVLGVAGGIAQYIFANGIPVGYQAWMGAGGLGLAVGLAACGVYDFLDGRLPKVES